MKPVNQCTTGIAGLALIASLFILSCNPSPSSRQETLPSGNQGTAPLGWTVPEEPIPCIPLTSHCLAPMPSNLFTRPDPSTPTGIRVHLTEEHLSEGVFAYAIQYLELPLLNAADGFSPVGQIVVPLPGPVSEQDLPADLESSVRPDSPILILDTGSGSRVPFHIRLDPKGLHYQPPQYFLVMIPAVPLEPGTAHVVVLRKGLRQPDGSLLPPYPAFEQILSQKTVHDPGLEPLAGLFANLFDYLEEDWTLGREELLLAFDFTTRSAESLFSPLLHMRDLTDRWAVENPPEALVRSVRYQTLDPHEACEITGSYISPSFRTPDRKIVLFDERNLPTLQGTEEVDFILKIPKGPPGTRVPVVIFGHGLWVFKETMIQITRDLLGEGFAILAIDAACHGSRIDTDGSIARLFKLETVQEAVSCLAQTIADELTLVHLLKGDLASPGLIPVASRRTRNDEPPDLDTRQIYYVGQSMGTVIGLTFVSLSRDISTAVLNVPGSGIVSIVTNGTITAPVVGDRFIPRGTNPLDAQILYVSGQSFVDYLDPMNFAPQLRRNLFTEHDAEKQILLQQSRNDGFIPNWVTDTMARALGIPVVEPFVYLPYKIDSVPSPAAGSGVFQYEFTTNPYLAHLLLVLVKESRRQLVEYLKSSHETGRAVILDPYLLN